MNQWSRKDAEAHFNDVIDAARLAPQVVTDGAETAAVVVGAEEYARLTGKTATPKLVKDGKEMTFADHLLAMPVREGFDFDRRSPKRGDVDF